MADIAARDVEILVHTSAPSRGPDDARYRALARAYLDFRPQARRRIVPMAQTGSHGEVIDESSGSQGQEHQAPSVQEERDSEASFRPDEEEDYGSLISEPFTHSLLDHIQQPEGFDSPILSFNSVINNADSPAFRGHVTRSRMGRRGEEEIQDSWQRFPSEIADSQPEVAGGQVATSSPTRVLDSFIHEEALIEYSSGETRGNEPPPTESSSGGFPTRSQVEIIDYVPLLVANNGRIESEEELGLSSTRWENPSSSSEVVPQDSSPSPVKRRSQLSPNVLRTRSTNKRSTQDPDIHLKRKWIITRSSSQEGLQASSAPPKSNTEPSSYLEIPDTHAIKRQRTEGSNVVDDRVVASSASHDHRVTRSQTRERTETSRSFTVARDKAINRNNGSYIEAHRKEIPETESQKLQALGSSSTKGNLQGQTVGQSTKIPSSAASEEISASDSQIYCGVVAKTSMKEKHNGQATSSAELPTFIASKEIPGTDSQELPQKTTPVAAPAAPDIITSSIEIATSTETREFPATTSPIRVPNRSCMPNEITTSSKLSLTITSLTTTRSHAPSPLKLSNVAGAPKSSPPLPTPPTPMRQPALTFSHLLEIHPSHPRTSTGDLTVSMLITPRLTQLISKLPVTLYRPLYQERELRDMERGFWRVNWGVLKKELRERCWEYLGNFITRDLAGWGVWCIREGEGEGKDDNLVLRVYCWGCVVKHIYCLIYVASENKIKNLGATWRGGDGEPVVRMA